ncbi:hypothetical protein DMC63_37970 [Streptomyces sp. WAC 05977]|nr:hypothetical protein DMC63_37970 [Streptomyces sp. WAC 05977]
MFTTTTDHFEVYGDATFVAAADRFDDVLAEPVERNRELVALLTPSAITIPPADLPAADLPEYEPTLTDLRAIETFDHAAVDDWIASAVTLAAYEHRHQELLRVRAELPPMALVEDDDDEDLERAA